MKDTAVTSARCLAYVVESSKFKNSNLETTSLHPKYLLILHKYCKVFHT